jgi:hypothetical protein
MPQSARLQTVNKCSQCGHEWVQRGMRLEVRPKRPTPQDMKSVLCPKCKSPHWDNPFKVASPQKGRRKAYGQ